MRFGISHFPVVNAAILVHDKNARTVKKVDDFQYIQDRIFLVATAWIRRLLEPNPTLKLSFLNRRNIIILALSIFVFKFVTVSSNAAQRILI